MKTVIAILCLLLCVGCSYEGQRIVDYIDNPRSIIRDPHYARYQEQRDALESQYLNKKIPYAEYVEKLKEIDEKYDREIKKRSEIIDSAY